MKSFRTSGRAPRSPKFGPLRTTVVEQDGVRYLHFGTEWVQGAIASTTLISWYWNISSK